MWTLRTGRRQQERARKPASRSRQTTIGARNWASALRDFVLAMDWGRRRTIFPRVVILAQLQFSQPRPLLLEPRLELQPYKTYIPPRGDFERHPICTTVCCSKQRTS
jgi:hypothetical protein